MLLSALVFSIGMVAGLLAVLIVVFLWVAVAGPLQEMLCERFLDPKAEVEPKPDIEADGSYGVLVSDIHLDTWDYVSGSKPAGFLAFLEWVRGQSQVSDLYINGDIMDMPPHPLNQPDVPVLTVEPGAHASYPNISSGPLGVLQPQFEPALRTISELGMRDAAFPELRVTFTTGNHDIGVEGLRYVRPDLPWSSIHVAWNPALRVKLAKESWLYVEHGHRYDPFLWLYLRYAILDLVRGRGRLATQRGGKVGMGKQSRLRGEVEQSAATHPWEGQQEVKPAPQEGLLVTLARYRFRQAARKVFRSMRTTDPNVKVITCGHTHIPDRYRFCGNRLYVNSGDWAGNDTHQCFVLIHPNGVVSGPHQWRNAAEADQLLSTP